MPNPLTAPEILDREFLEVRAKLLQVAAALDRLDRAEGSVERDPRLDKLRRGIDILHEAKPGRAERLQLAFSRTYESNWQTKLGVKSSHGA